MRSRIFRLCAACAAIPLPAAVLAGDLEGRVIQASGLPEAGATVRLLDAGRIATSDVRGHFHFEDLPAGEYTLRIEAGEDMETRHVSIARDGVVSIDVVLAAELDAIEVSASAFGRSALELAQPVEIIGGDELKLLAEASIGATLSSQLGVTSTYFGPASGRPVIRGLTGNRVRVQQDGIGSMDVSSLSPDHAVAIEPLLIDSVEIVKGAATLLYGNGAFGGVINMTDSRIPEESPYTPFSGALELRGDTAADQRSFVARFDGGGERLAWHADAFTRNSDEVEIPVPAESEILHEAEGHAEEEAAHLEPLANSDVETRGGALGGSWFGESGFFGMSVSTYESNYGVPGHAHEEEEGAPEPAHEEGVRIDLEQLRYDIKGRIDNPFSGIESLKFRAGYNDYEHREIEHGAVATTFVNDAYDARLEMTHAPLAEWRGAFGVQLRGRDFAAVGEEAYVPPTDARSIGVFLVEEREFDQWRVEAGGRVETQEQDPQGFAGQSDTAFSASAGIVRKLGNAQSVGVNFTRAQRMPDIEERYSEGPHLATLQYEIGDPALDTETANNIDLTWRKAGDGVNWTLNLYYNRVDDFIYLDNTGAEIDGLPVAVYTQADAVLKGYEAEVVLPLLEESGDSLDLRLFSDYTRGTLDGGGNLPRIPPLRFGAGLDYTTAKWTAGVEAIRYDEQDKVAANELPTEGYVMLDASVSWRIFTPHADWNVFVRASNLLDEEARRHSSFLKDLAPLPGRNFTVGVRAGF
ncbi:MAG TPA: TonB-dependent receptor [Gammaproteobacteria bacterium]